MNVETLTRPDNTAEKKTQEVVFPFPEEAAQEKLSVEDVPVIMEIKNIDKSYSGSSKVLKDISFDIRKGEVLSIIGPSGAGKSTLLRIINRMIEPNSGVIRFQDKDTLNMKGKALRHMRTDIGMIFQHYNLVDRLSVFENVLHGRLGYKSSLQGIFSMYSEAEKEKAVEIISELGISEQIYSRCDELSGGQKQRVGIARALIQDPKIILCDEPIASLDPNSSRIIMEYLRRISREKDITIIVNLHQLDVAKQYSDRIIGLNDGSIVFNDVPEAITAESINHIYGSNLEELIVE
ncbi:phosphonate ABC transporter ATP-binding protein [Salinicoccus hispanicus]|uniref:Phosphonate ABC transporter ATP-binding protein n=1 Tax=Salinicoccus hispanicus TaxID=157225 RepID=A0A6N8TZ52_9STAP|nr:phosphonate ABC transporter ATP-binding protein [Salinicoccus hispanicus]MXQ51070.1 phosphonate ABC transporter ATP-binding protein [Salinicoccus hispanicus]